MACSSSSVPIWLSMRFRRSAISFRSALIDEFICCMLLRSSSGFWSRCRSPFLMSSSWFLFLIICPWRYFKLFSQRLFDCTNPSLNEVMGCKSVVSTGCAVSYTGTVSRGTCTFCAANSSMSGLLHIPISSCRGIPRRWFGNAEKKGLLAGMCLMP